MSRDGRHLYVSNRGHDALTVYDVGAEGLVTPRQWTPSGGKWPWFSALTEDSRMIVANNLSDAMTIFDIDTRGELRASDQVTVRRPIFIAPSGISGRLRALYRPPPARAPWLPSMQTRFPPLADVAHCRWMADESQKSNALVDHVRLDVGR
jgi:hypothetical protein